MVTRAGKELLRNTIRNTGYHNKLIEEDEMWRHWEMGKGLTMMVTDDSLRKRMRMDEYPGPSVKRESSKSKINMKELRKQKQAARECRWQGLQDNYWTRKLMETEEKDPTRWGHSGYKELYPEEFGNSKPSLSSSGKVSSNSQKRKKHKQHKHIKKHKKRRRRHHSSDNESAVEHQNIEHRRSSSRDQNKPRTRSCSQETSERKPFPWEINRNPNPSPSPVSQVSSHSNSDISRSRSKSSSVIITDSDSSESYRLGSDVSQTSLEKRKEYLKRKLEILSRDTSDSNQSDSDYSDRNGEEQRTIEEFVPKNDCHSSEEEEEKTYYGRSRRKLKSQIVSHKSKK